MLGQILLQPPLLRRARRAATDRGAVGVQRDQVPGTDVEAVIPCRGEPALRPK
jgi:hypothetical protein